MTLTENRVAVKIIKQEMQGAIALPQGHRSKTERGIVVATGPGTTLDDGTRSPMQVKKGQTVVLEPYFDEDRTELEIDGEKCIVVRETSIIGWYE